MKLIPLTQGKFAQVDDEDYERISKFKWCAHRDARGGFRATRTLKGTNIGIGMHNEVLSVSRSTRVDHKNRDGLNNKKTNLRKATCSQNGANRGPDRDNTSGFKGVSKTKRIRNPWQALITVRGKKMFLGQFKTPFLASVAYASAARKYFGEFARTK
jgi:hypothetical protein